MVTAHSLSLAAEDLQQGECLAWIFSVGFFQDLLPTPFPSAGMQQPSTVLQQAGNNTQTPPCNFVPEVQIPTPIYFQALQLASGK